MTRTSTDVGAGLAPARPPRAIRLGERIHVIGAAGAGASAAALLARHAGALVSGCDAGGPSPYSAALAAAAIELAWAHGADHVRRVPRPDRLAVTKALTAIDPDNPELAAARAAGIPIEPWQQVIADAALGRRLVAIAGTHGKSTTAGWLVHVLAAAGMDPMAFVGAGMAATPGSGAPASTARLGSGSIFVVEADEYAGNFDPYRPALAVLTSVEWDHPDVFPDAAAVEAALAAWLARMERDADLVANVGDPGVRRVLGRLGRAGPGRRIGYALDGTGRADDAARGPAGLPPTLVGTVVAAGPSGTTLRIQGLADAAGVDVELPTAGRHNAENALAVAGAASRLGVEAAAIATGLATFGGIARRLERKGAAAGVVVYDDYGHHPTAIRSTIEAVRQREPGRRVWAVYEPLTYHRTAALLQPFGDALATADAVAVASIWAGRDPDTSVATPEGLAAAVRAANPRITVAAPGSVDATASWLASAVRPGDVVLVMGGGRSYRIAEELLELLGA